MSGIEERPVEELTAPPTRLVSEGRHPHLSGFRDGLLAAFVIVALAAAAGIIAIPALRGSAASPSPSMPAMAVIPSPSPTVRPDVTPHFACAASNGGVPIATLRSDNVPGPRGLLIGGSFSQGAPTDTAAPTVVAPSGQAFSIWIEGRRCAIAWSITLGQQTLVSVSNSKANPAIDSQNVIAIDLNTMHDREALLQAHLVFPDGDATFAWDVQLVAPAPDLAVLARDDGTEPAIEMLLGCAQTIQFANGPGDSTGTPCPSDVPADLRTLVAAPGSVVDFITGNTFVLPALPGVPVTCGQVGGDPATFTEDPACRLGYASTLGSGFAFSVPEGRGNWVVAVHGCEDTGLARICGTWYGRIDTVHPVPSQGS